MLDITAVSKMYSGFGLVLQYFLNGSWSQMDLDATVQEDILHLFVRDARQLGRFAKADVTGGVGVVWKDYRVDYSYIPLKSGWGDSHRLSVGIGW